MDRARAALVLLLVVGCSSARKVDPERARGYYNEGKVAQGKGKHERAVEAFSDAIKYNATFSSAYFARAYSYLQMKALEKPPMPTRELVDRALADYSAAVSMNPTFADAYFSRAMLHASRANYSAAVSDLLVCARYSPRDPEPHLVLGELYEAKYENQVPLAMKHYDEYTKLGGTNEAVKQKVALWKQLAASAETPKKNATADDEKKAQELHEQFKLLYPQKEKEAFQAIEELATKYSHTKYFQKYATALTALYNALKEKTGNPK